MRRSARNGCAVSKGSQRAQARKMAKKGVVYNGQKRKLVALLSIFILLALVSVSVSNLAAENTDAVF